MISNEDPTILFTKLNQCSVTIISVALLAVFRTRTRFNKIKIFALDKN